MWPFSSPYPEVSCNSLKNEYDYIIIGGGTAGCVLANRLSKDRDVSVLLIERGFANDTWSSRIPLFSNPFSPTPGPTLRQNSAPDDFLGGRIHELINGSGLGGTSRVNAMIYTRGHAAEYNKWSVDGRKGWSYNDVLPFFKKSQHSLLPKPSTEVGVKGEWKTRIHETTYFEHTTYLHKAAASLGLPFIPDINDSSNPAYGSSKCHYTLDEYGRRQSTFAAFLPVELVNQRHNLTICTGAIVTRVDLKLGSDGVPQAEGVFIQQDASEPVPTVHVTAKREIVLCGGPLSNPQILQRSGIGSASLLRSLDIPVLKDLPGVGSYLQDHIAAPIIYTNALEDSFVIYETKPLLFLREVLKYFIRGTGMLTCPVTDVSIFANSKHLDSEMKNIASPAESDSRDPNNIPDIEIMSTAYYTTGEAFDKSQGRFGLLCVNLRPQSTGSIEIVSKDSREPPKISLNSLSSPNDWNVLRASMRLSMALAKQMTIDGYPLKDDIVPKSDSDHDLDAHIRKYARTTYHYSSTCRMAPEDDASPGVVDDELRVHGVRNLRIADSSIFPQIPATHLQAPSVMIAERCADMIIHSNLGRV